MRTGPFSDSRVIEQLNAHFVPVLAVNEDYRGDGPAPADERAEYRRIYREALAAKFSTGTVHVYIVEPGGQPIGTLHVATAAKTDKLLELLDSVVRKYDLKPGKPVVQPRPLSAAPPVKEGGLVLHLTARPLKGGGSWGGVSENWIVYSPEEVEKLLPSGKVKVGQTWPLDAKLAARLLTHFYPVTENNDVTKNRIEKQELTARVLSVADGVARARLDGELRMKHNFYHKDDGRTVVATFSGYLDVEVARGKLRAVRLATRQASYGGGTFAVAVRSVN
jgi:hypothetical protein